jgi:hypothetical protein
LSSRPELLIPKGDEERSGGICCFCRRAKEVDVSLNQWIASAVAQKVEVVETAADFFKKRAGKATGVGLMKLLRTAPEATPEPEDEMR